MTLPVITSYEVKTSRTEQKIPVVNGVHLHSIYNPFKEAEGLIDTNADILKNKNEVLVLGLGFGYHINAIADRLEQSHGENFRIIVIEPNMQVNDDCFSFNLLNKKNVLVYSGFEPNELYSDLDLIHFLLRKPAMIAHPASFNLYQNYFKTILTFQAPKTIGKMIEFVESDEIKKYLGTFDSEDTFENVFYNELPNKAVLTQNDFLSMALVEMTRKTLAKNSQLGDQ